MMNAAKKRDPWNEASELAHEYLQSRIDPETWKLIRQANYDLYYGPVGDGAYGDPAESDLDEWASYPGFSKACDAIADALKGLPRTLYVDLDCDYVTETEPEPERCEDCKGEGKIDRDSEEYAERSKEAWHGYTDPSCDTCHGRGEFEASGDWYKLEAEEIRKAIVGRELAGYL